MRCSDDVLERDCKRRNPPGDDRRDRICHSRFIDRPRIVAAFIAAREESLETLLPVNIEGLASRIGIEAGTGKAGNAGPLLLVLG